MTLGCPQGYAEKVSLISQGKGQMKPRGLASLPPECTENCRKSKLRIFFKMNPVYVVYYIDGAHYTKEQRAILAARTNCKTKEGKYQFVIQK